VWVDHGADAQAFGSSEDFVLVRAEQRGVAGGGGDVVLGEGPGELVGEGGEVVGLNLCETDFGQAVEGAGKVFFDGVPYGVSWTE
jgi:hypothetical protein